MMGVWFRLGWGGYYLSWSIRSRSRSRSSRKSSSGIYHVGFFVVSILLGFDSSSLLESETLTRGFGSMICC